MKDLLEKAQDYLDSGEPIPEKLISKLNNSQLDTLSGMIALKNGLGTELDKYISSKPFSRTTYKRQPTTRLAVWAAAAVLIMSFGIPVYRTIDNNRLVKLETREFVSEITESNWTMDILSEDSLSTDWFNAEPVVMETF